MVRNFRDLEEAQSWKEHKVYSVVAPKSSRGWKFKSARVPGMERPDDADSSRPQLSIQICWYCSRNYASISAGQGEAGTLANCLYENMLTTLRKDWQGTKLLVMSRNKDTSLKVQEFWRRWLISICFRLGSVELVVDRMWKGKHEP